jgi:tetratricopeptide (TPR) repeat protein
VLASRRFRGPFQIRRVVRAEIALSAARVDEAIEWARRAVDKRPDDPHAHLLLARAMYERKCEGNADFAEIERQVELAVAARPPTARTLTVAAYMTYLLYARGFADLDRVRDYTSRARSAAAGSKGFPYGTTLAHLEASLADRDGRLEAAEVGYRKAIAEQAQALRRRKAFNKVDGVHVTSVYVLAETNPHIVVD